MTVFICSWLEGFQPLTAAHIRNTHSGVWCKSLWLDHLFQYFLQSLFRSFLNCKLGMLHDASMLLDIQQFCIKKFYSSLCMSSLCIGFCRPALSSSHFKYLMNTIRPCRNICAFRGRLSSAAPWLFACLDVTDSWTKHESYFAFWYERHSICRNTLHTNQLAFRKYHRTANVAAAAPPASNAFLFQSILHLVASFVMDSGKTKMNKGPCRMSSPAPLTTHHLSIVVTVTIWLKLMFEGAWLSNCKCINLKLDSNIFET